VLPPVPGVSFANRKVVFWPFVIALTPHSAPAHYAAGQLQDKKGVSPMRPMILLAVAAGLALAVSVSGFWITSPPSKSAAVDRHGMTLKTVDLPVHEIPSP